MRWLLERKADPNVSVLGSPSSGPAPLRRLLETSFAAPERRFEVEALLDAVDLLLAHGARGDDAGECGLSALLVASFSFALDVGTANDPDVRYDLDDAGKRRILAAKYGTAKGPRLVETLRRLVARGGRWSVDGCAGRRHDMGRAVAAVEAFLPDTSRAEFRSLLLGAR